MEQITAFKSNDREVMNDNEVGEIKAALEGVSMKEDLINQFPILELPIELVRVIYSYFDHHTRRALKMNSVMEEIRAEVEQKFEKLKIEMEEDGAHVSFANIDRTIPHSDAEKEFEALGCNKFFDKVTYESPLLREQRPMHALKFIRAKNIELNISKFDLLDFQCVTQNKEEVFVHISEDDDHADLDSIYEELQEMNREDSDLKTLTIESDLDDDRLEFMDNLGVYEEEGTYLSRNRNICVSNRWKHVYGEVDIEDRRLLITIRPYWYSDEYVTYEDGYVTFKFVERYEEKDEEED